MAERTVAVELIAKVQGYVAGISTSVKATKEFGGELERLRKTNSSGMHAISSSATAAGLSLAALAGWAVKTSMEFDKQMSAVKAASGATATEMDNLRKGALEAGKATVFSATEAAQAEVELARAGLSTSEILGGALSGSLSLAAAGQLDLAEAATVSVQAMTIFGLKGKDVGHVADVLAAGANASVTDVHDLSMAMRMSGIAASQFGLSMEETVGTLSAFAQNALRGSDAGTSLKQLLLQLAAPSVKAKDLMKELGIQAYDASGNFVGLSKLAGELQDKLGGLTQEQRQSALATIFGSDAMRAANILYQQGAQGIQDWTKKVDQQGAASKTAATMTDNLAGDIERLKGQLETLFIESSTGTNSGLRILVQALDHLVGLFTDLPGPVKNGIVVLAGLSGAALLAAAAWLKVRRTVGDAMDALNKAGPVSANVAVGLEKSTRWASKAAVALAAVAAAGQAVDAIFGDPLNAQVNALARGLAKFGKDGTVAGEMARVFGEDLTHLDDALKSMDTGVWTDMTSGFAGTVEGLTGTGHLFEDSLTRTKERIAALDTAMAQLVTSGHSADAEAAFRSLADEGAKFGISTNELNKALPEYAAALDEAKNGTDAQGQAAMAAAVKQADLASSLDDLVAKGKTLTDIWTELNGTMVNSDAALLSAKEKIEALGEVFKDNHGKIVGNTIEALRNRTALEAAAEAAVKAAQAYYEQHVAADGQTKALAGANRILAESKVAAEKSANATGKAKNEVKKLADQLFQLPAQKTVNIKVNTSWFGATLNELRSTLSALANWAGGSTKAPKKHAAGGPNEPGMNIYGEQGPELHFDTSPGYTIPAQQTAALLAGPRSTRHDITVVVKDTSGRTLRKEMISDAVQRNVPQTRINAAYP